ncbi:MAG: hypothetical protein AMXMBFR84_37760 [Candidatus Hydrogenedentota bacterium]
MCMLDALLPKLVIVESQLKSSARQAMAAAGEVRLIIDGITRQQAENGLTPPEAGHVLTQ